MAEETPECDDTSLFRGGSYSLFWLARACSTLSFQMAAVALGWQMYDITHSTFELGLIGLIQFLPILLLSLLVGHVADHFNRKTIMGLSQILSALTVCWLAVGSLLHCLHAPSLYVAAAVIGTARAFERPSTLALLPGLVRRSQVAHAVATSSSATQTASILGPAAGGLLYGFGPQAAYFGCICMFSVAAALTSRIKPLRDTRDKQDFSLESTLVGIRFILDHGKVLGAISLDLFVVVLGGATALLPVYARTILHVGPWGLGLLRASPAMGALLVSVYLAHHPVRKSAGSRMFLGVIVFGLATIGFALSHNVALSMALLFTLGAADVISVVVRSSLVQMETPDHIRGRVSAVNSLFIGTSNQLGQFESGFTASLWGIIPATILGGMGSIGIALLWMWLFPTLKKVDSLNQLVVSEASD